MDSNGTPGPSGAEQHPVPAEPPPSTIEDIAARVGDILGPGVRVASTFGRLVEKGVVVPAWRQVTDGESRWAVTAGVATAIGLQLAVPSRVSFQPRWLLPVVAILFLATIALTGPKRLNHRSRHLRALSLAMIATISIGNVVSAGRLMTQLVEGKAELEAGPLLLVGFAIWLTNVIVFALWYWEFDRGGPVLRANAIKPHPDFLFPQMQSPEFAPPDWEPLFVDYVYLSFTNATAFSPTDVLPFSRWAKLAMMLQSIISLATVALVIARAVNILG